MKRLLLPVIMCLLLTTAFAGEIRLEGHYYGNNLYVMNPSLGDGFCVTGVSVNGVSTRDEIRSNAFEIDFADLGLTNGTPVMVVISHHDGCTPKVTNPQVISADQFFSFVSIKMDRNNKLNWEISGNTGTRPFVIEQFRWNRWAVVGEVAASDTAENGIYVATVSFHSGLNQFRVMRPDAYGQPVYSKVTKYNNTKQAAVELASSRVSQKLEFSAPTFWELYGLNGDYIAGGFDQEVDVSNLEKGKYFLNFDVQSVTISKK
mgnify:CR=1 FL=1